METTKQLPEKVIIKGNATTRKVWIDGKELLPGRSQKVINHSPDGFMWGYGGSGPAQLALAICLEFVTEQRAKAIYQQFKFKTIAQLPARKDFEVELDLTQEIGLLTEFKPWQ